MNTVAKDPELVPEVEGEVFEIDAGVALEAQTRGEIDIQIVTAKRFPRSIKQFMNDATEMACLDKKVAAACGYALPRKENGQTKMITGPSARLAEICASAWGHLRFDGRVLAIEEKFVVSRGVAWDMQRNVAAAFEVRRRITTSQGRRYSDDMIVVTSNAASSIALRNAIFKVIPAPFWRQIYERAMEVAAGDIKSIEQNRAEVLKAFKELGVEPKKVFDLIGVKGHQDITLEHISTLRGLLNAIKEGDTTVEDAFADPTLQTPKNAPAKPEMFDNWLIDIETVAKDGFEAFSKAWAASPEAHRRYLAATQPGKQDALKASATAVGGQS